MPGDAPVPRAAEPRLDSPSASRAGPPGRVVVVGAGMAGLAAAHELGAAGVDVVVVDKGRSVGGRLATRRVADARLDHGAQFFTVRTPAFAKRVDDWVERGIVKVWTHGFGRGSFDDHAPDGHPRYVAVDGMNALAKDLAARLPGSVRIETSTMAFTVRRRDDGPPWEVAIDDGTSRPADAVVLTCPLPQTVALLVDSGLDLERELVFTDYDRTLGLLVVLDRPSAVPDPGGVQAEGIFQFVGDNQAKGISTVPAVTFHADPEWSESHWDDDPDEVRLLLEEEARPWLGDARIVESQLKRWRFATPQTVWPDPCRVAADGAIVLAGDAFAGPRVEGAHNSGLAAAHALLG